MYTDAESEWMAAFAGDEPGNEPKFIRRWRRILTSPDVTVVAVDVDGCLGGTISMWPEGGVNYVAGWVRRDCWGEGRGTAALSAFLQNAPRPLRARVAFDNLASQRVLEKTGFRRIGHQRGYANVRGEVVEEFLYELA